MFQYAFGRANAIRLGAELKFELTNPTLIIHHGFELERVFNIKATEATKMDVYFLLGIYRHRLVRKAINALGLSKVFKTPYVEEQHFNFSPEMLNFREHSYVNGYWQSEKYFLAIENEIRSDFVFKLQFSQQNAEVSEKISKSNSVSLHIRRGDYVSNPEVTAVHGLCTIEYYQMAIKYIAERVHLPNFYIFSDDIAWVQNNLKINYPHQYINHNHGSESFNDMRLMSLCKHHIIANSSFSWWGAWLNESADKIVVAPKYWFSYEINSQDLIPTSWARL